MHPGQVARPQGGPSGGKAKPLKSASPKGIPNPTVTQNEEGRSTTRQYKYI